MDPESKKLLENTFALAEENNKMLRHIRRSQKVASFMRVVYWILIIGISYVSYLFLQPYVNQMQKLYQGASASLNQIKSVK